MLSFADADHVLTAASCVEGAGYVFVAAGEHDLQNTDFTEQVLEHPYMFNTIDGRR